MNAFKIKYDGLPGDLLYSNATKFGLYTISYGSYIGNPGYGDNNGIISCGNCNGFNTYLYGEPFIFWRHLSDAGLIDGNYGAGLNIAAESGAQNSSTLNNFLPAAKLTGSTIEVNSFDGKNYFLLASLNSIVGVGSHGTANNPLTAQESYKIDSKTDDGVPGSGKIVAIEVTGSTLDNNPTWKTVSGLNTCVSSSAYSVNPGNTKACSLRFDFP